MPKQLDITFTLDDGKIPKTRAEQIRRHLSLYGDREVRMRISRPKRSPSQNRHYWGFIIRPIKIALLESGVGFMETNDGIKAVTDQALHTYFKHKYLHVRPVVLFGEDVTLPPTTTELDATSFHDYVEKIKDDEQVRQLNIHFEEPGEEFRSYSISELPY